MRLTAMLAEYLAAAGFKVDRAPTARQGLSALDRRPSLGRAPPPGALVAGAVGGAAYPVTARLTRRLENLRSGVESWGHAVELPVEGPAPA